MDHIENLKNGTKYAPKNRGKELTATKINYDSGEVKKISLLNVNIVKDLKTSQFLLSKVLLIANDEFVFEVYKKKKEDVLIKVKLD